MDQQEVDHQWQDPSKEDDAQD